MEKTTPPLPTETISKAVTALLKWKSSNSSSQKTQLLPTDEFLYLVLTLNKIPAKPRTNAHKIPLPNPLFTPETSEFCLFVHDSLSQSAKQKVSELSLPISKVIKLSKLKKDYKAYEQKRKLCDSYDMFFSDKRIIPLLPNAIGKQFYRKKKIPAPIELGRGNWKEQIDRICKSAMLYLSTGTCSVIKVGKASMGKEEIVENVIAAIKGIAEVVPKKWGNVRAFHLKFSESLALPVYQKVPEMGLKIAGLGEGEEKIGEEKKKVVVVSGAGKGREKEKVSKKKGRIHEVKYMDNVIGDVGMVGEDESGSEDEEEEKVVEVEKSDNGKKRKKKEVKEVAKLKKDESGSEDEDEKVVEVEKSENGKKRKKGDGKKEVKKGLKGLKEKKDKVMKKSMSEKKSKKSKILM
ncbi:uncharacterized protein LOC104888891 [Beta vulgaris subsp. vulgaris]|uniref:uncharacterized protein LOC104888891 n=1 Tax=Beta vulgaris subsp. vulgaris TaxID=3555 RepID=UPI002036951B|nr:uncharacterized protein LOC104888891 [Beta vulgaris subsp. vulgaris]